METRAAPGPVSASAGTLRLAEAGAPRLPSPASTPSPSRPRTCVLSLRIGLLRARPTKGRTTRDLPRRSPPRSTAQSGLVHTAAASERRSFFTAKYYSAIGRWLIPHVHVSAVDAGGFCPS